MMERVHIWLDPDDPSPRRLMGYFAEVFAALDAAPRPFHVEIESADGAGSDAAIDFEQGEPVFRVEGRNAVHANFRRRWIAEHPVPLRLSRRGKTHLAFIPTTGNRVKVRRVGRW